MMSEATETKPPEIFDGVEEEDGTSLQATGDGETIDRLLELAVREGVSVDVLERLEAMHERIADRNARAAFFEALAAFQEDVPEIAKSNTAQIRTNSGNNFSYTYAPLEEITRTIRPVLRKHRLSYSWTTEGQEDGVLHVVCTLRHIGGHEERATFPVPVDTSARMTDAQKNGAALTYGKRQSLTSVLGLTTADDVDGAGSLATPITEEQVKDLNEMIGEADADVRKFCNYMEVDHLGEITQADFPKAVRMLRLKRKQKEEEQEGDEG